VAWSKGPGAMDCHNLGSGSSPDIQLHCGAQVREHPRAHGILSATVQTVRLAKLGSAVRTNGLAETCRRAVALPTFPDIAPGWRCLHRGKRIASREAASPGVTGLRLSQDRSNSHPLQAERNSHQTEAHQGPDDEPSHAEEANDRGQPSDASTSHHKPEQGPKNLTPSKGEMAAC